MGTTTIWLAISLLVYFAVLLFVSFYKNKNETKEDYFLGGRKTPYWILAMAFVAAWYGGNSALISVDRAFEQGLSSWWILGGPTVLAVLILLIFSSAIRRLGSMSQNGIITKRYNEATGNILVFILVLYFISWGASQMVAIGKFLASFFSFNYTVAVIVGIAVALIYSILGGFRAVVLTEMVQFFIMIAGLVIVMAVALFHSGGWSGIQAAAEAREVDGYFNLFGSFSQNFTFVLSFGLAFVIDGAVWQRISASRTPEEAKKTTFQALIYFIPLYFFVVITGMAAIGIFAELPEGGIVPALVSGYLNPVLASIVFVGIAAAIMSTMCTTLNAGSMYLTELYYKYVNPDASNKQVVRFGMFATLFVSIIGFIIAIRIQDALIVLSIASQILAAGVFVPMIFGFFWRRGTSVGAISCIITGSGFILYHFLVQLGIPLPTLWKDSVDIILTGFILGLIAYIVGSLLSKPNYEKADKFFEEAGLFPSKKVVEHKIAENE
ncbi:sodium:solute symporter family protein [Siminovitchia acidinfaciens]|uniref:Sodium:solute symporter family protein n=1 Tax=Siminovitchia acidinfaciens TaxID=2321395 RepID=A0A429Y6V7_9BACI|nr:sodium:solute symporter family protein [Siminovitchia acidinfaciens]RST77135.1 sodium:solute symporter family protein [Siminovitchia acidinfaciens]